MSESGVPVVQQVAQLLDLTEAEASEYLRLVRQGRKDHAEDDTAANEQFRLLNPGGANGSNQGCFPCERCDATAVPFVDDAFAIDPESLKVWHVSHPSLAPKTEGFRNNFSLQLMGRPLALCLSVTRACNLRCRYCYVHNRPDIAGGNLTAKIALAAVRLCNPERLSISFFGGEPLLRFGLIRQVVSGAQLACNKPKFHVTTNGLLLDDEKARFLAEHGFSMIVSLDGPQAIHNLNRPLAQAAGGEDSYSRTRRALDVLKRHGLSQSLTLRSTYTRDCVRIVERLEHLNALCDLGLGGHVSVEAVSSSEASCIDPSVGSTLGFDTEGALRLRDDYAAAFDWARERVKKGHRVRWHHLNTFASRILRRQPAPTECGAGYGFISVTPEGEVFACHREAGAPIGRADIGLDERARAIWLDNRFFQRQNCPDCWCRYICGGGCRADSVVHMGDIHVPYTTTCTIMQIIIANTIRLIHDLSDEERALIVQGGRQ